MTVVVRSAATGPDSSRVLMCHHTEVPCRQVKQTIGLSRYNGW